MTATASRPPRVSLTMIRTATPADLDAIAALHAEARATYYHGYIPDDAFDSPAEHARTRAGWAAAIECGAVLCAEKDGTVAGVAAFREVDHVMNLTGLHVDPERWRGGIGRALHTACVEAWQRAGVRTRPPRGIRAQQPRPVLLRPPRLVPGPGRAPYGQSSGAAAHCAARRGMSRG